MATGIEPEADAWLPERLVWAMLEVVGFTVVPGLAGLALLAAGGAGLLARRRRSK